MSTELKLSELYRLKEQKYLKMGVPDAKKAAAYAVTDIMNMLKGQEQYMEQLLDEEIEDAKKSA